MGRAASAVISRLRVTWFGSVLAIVWVIGLIAAPIDRHCIAIAAVKGGPSGIFCTSTPALERPTGVGLLLLMGFVAVIATVPLAFPRRRALLAVGVGSAAVATTVLALAFDYPSYLAMGQLGLYWTSEARSVLFLLLPVSLLWIVAGIRRPAG